MGVKPLLDAVIDYLPAPTDIASIECTDKDGNEVLRHPSDQEPFTALAFKVMTDPFVGKLNILQSILRSSKKWFLCIKFNKRH